MTTDTNPVGRPLKFKSVEELQSRIDEYFSECDRDEDTRTWEHGEPFEHEGKELCMECKMSFSDSYGFPSRGCILVDGELKERERYTITGLALALDTTRETLLDYEKRDEFSDTIKKAKLRVENQYEKSLQESGRSGDIFALKNFNWKDNKGIDHTSGGEPIKVTFDSTFNK